MNTRAGDWCDPPPMSPGKWALFAAELEERPGDWRCIYDNRQARHSYVLEKLRKLGCEVTAREVNTDEGRFYSAWARWPEEKG